MGFQSSTENYEFTCLKGGEGRRDKKRSRTIMNERGEGRRKRREFGGQNKLAIKSKSIQIDF